jgi:predicted  nucleic acid-binding Zn-ribbon protein
MGLLFASAASAGAVQVTPISKVIDLLGGMEATITKEGEEAAKLKTEKDTWCKDTSVNLGFEIKTGTDEVAELEAKIGKEAAAMSSLKENIESLAEEIAKDDADLKAATTVRTKEIADFEAEEAELKETIDALQRAISVLEREMAKSSTAFVQVQSAGSVIKALEVMVRASAFSSADATRLTAFVQSANTEEDAGAPDAAAYTSKSGGIVDVLEDLLDKANTQLSESRDKESKAQHAYAMLKQSLEDSIKYGNKDMDEAKVASAKASEEKADAEGSLDAVSKDLAEDKTMLEETTKQCESYAEDYDAEVKSRAEELAAVQKAKAILVESIEGADSVAYGFQQITAPSFSFLQVQRRSPDRSESQRSALRFVRELARKSKSPALSQLATHMASAVRLGAAAGEDPFEKVKGLITEMISKLEKEAGEDAEMKAYCDREMSESKEKKEEKKTLVEKLSTKIEQMTADSAKLKDSVATLQKELADLAALQSKMDDLRSKENALFVSQKKELSDGITGVEAATKVLKEYYAQADKAHDAKEGAGGSIVAMLEVVLSDFTKTLAEITAAEDSAASEYEVTTQDNKVAKAAKEKDVEYQTKEAAALDKSVTEATADRATTQSELDAVNEYLAKLEDMCIAKPETYQERADRRAAEIAGLKKALEILSA